MLVRGTPEDNLERSVLAPYNPQVINLLLFGVWHLHTVTQHNNCVVYEGDGDGHLKVQKAECVIQLTGIYLKINVPLDDC